MKAIIVGLLVALLPVTAEAHGRYYRSYRGHNHHGEVVIGAALGLTALTIAAVSPRVYRSDPWCYPRVVRVSDCSPRYYGYPERVRYYEPVRRYEPSVAVYSAPYSVAPTLPPNCKTTTTEYRDGRPVRVITREYRDAAVVSESVQEVPVQASP